MVAKSTPAILIALALSIPMVIFIASDRTEANTGIIFQDGFEVVQEGNDLSSIWKHGDWNPNSGDDYWEIPLLSIDNRPHQGAKSVWCAYIGSSPADPVCHYDSNMDSYLRLPLNVSAYENVNASFYYWADTTNLNDSLTVNCMNITGAVTRLWNQSANNSEGWKLVSVGIPLDSVYLEFNFTSDADVVGSHEGVYIDDLLISGTDSMAPCSMIGALSTYYDTQLISVTFNANDTGGAGVAYVELWYQKDSSGSFIKYVTTSNSLGHWQSSPIPFNSSFTGGDGTYELYTIAVDKFDNKEQFSAGNSITVIDTTSPWAGVFVTGVEGSEGWYTSNVTLALYPTEKTSGIANIRYMITGGPEKSLIWQNYDPAGLFLSLNGNHSISFNLTDNATNYAVRKANVLIDKTIPSANAELLGTPGNDGWYLGQVKVIITGSDAISGISSIGYKVDSGSLQTYDGNLTITKSGMTNISYYSVDVAGNSGKATPQTLSFKLDPIAPSCSMPGEQTAFTKSDVSLNWQANDNESGIDHFEISFDGAAFSEVGNDTVAYKTLADGQHAFKVRAVDIAGNVGTAFYHNFTVDTSVFSPGGPMGPWLDIAITAPIIAVLLLLLMKRRAKTAQESDKSPEE